MSIPANPARCLSDEDLVAYLASELPPGNLKSIRLHLQDCAACSDRHDALVLRQNLLQDQLRAAMSAAAKSSESSKKQPHRSADRVPRSAGAIAGADEPSSRFMDRKAAGARQIGRATVPLGEPPPPAAIPRTKAEAPDPEIGRRIGPYEIRKRIGQGGMGNVYLAARVDDFKQTVAIKLIRRGLDTEEILKRFERERQVLAAMKHPNIARLLDGGTTGDGLPYFVMEYIEGRPIDEYCDSRKLTTLQRIRLFQQVCAAVQFAHQNAVIHRDLKPSNILVVEDPTLASPDTPSGRPGRPEPQSVTVKLLDFGIAKLTNPELGFQSLAFTQNDYRFMTPEYASPEQVRGGPITTASDVYSLGVVLYELLTGHRPYRFLTRAFQEIEQIVCEREPPRPSEVISRTESVLTGAGTTRTISPEVISRTRDGTPDRLRRRLSGDLDNIILTAMRKEPLRRFQTVATLSADLTRHLTYEPVVARPASVGYRLNRFVRKHRAALSVATGFCVLALASAIWLAALYREALVQRGIAVQQSTRAQMQEQKRGAYQKLFSDTLSKRRGVNLRLSDTFAAIADELAQNPPEDPQSDAWTRSLLGELFGYIGEYKQAREQLERALAMQRKDRSTSGEDLADTLERLAAVRFSADSAVSEAESLLFEAADLRSVESAARFAATLVQWGDVRHESGDTTTASRLYARALETVGNNPDGERVRADAIHNQAYVLNVLGESDSAEALFRMIVARDRADHSTDAADLAASVNNLAYALLFQLLPDPARPLLSEALTLRIQQFGEGKLPVADSRNALAVLALISGDLPLAEQHCRTAIAIYDAAVEPNHLGRAFTQVRLAMILAEQGRADEATDLYQQAEAAYRSQLGRVPDFAPLAFWQLRGQLAQRRGESVAAEELYNSALEALTFESDEDRIYRARIRADVTRLHLSRGDVGTAESLARDVLEVRRTVLGAEHASCASASELLADVQLAKSEYAAALDTLDEAARIQAIATPGADWLVAMRRIGRIAALTGLGRTTEAETERAAIRREMSKILGEQDPRLRRLEAGPN